MIETDQFIIAGTTKIKNRTFYFCECKICGKRCVRRMDYVKTQRNKSCGCLRIKMLVGKNHPHWTGHGYIPGWYWNRCVRNSKGRNIDFNISIEYGNELLIQQNMLCALSKLPITINITIFGEETTASLDRINSDKGYIIGNVQWVHKDINKMKMDFSMEEFRYYCNLVSKNT